jgi:hypothetical protein
MVIISIYVSNMCRHAVDLSKPVTYYPASLEAIATVFALEVPRVALAILPATASVERAVFDMRSLGINAHGLDVLVGNRGASYLLRNGTTPVEDPTLLVATLATVRGLDLPDLTHVFILGADPADLDQDAYMHAAGRVGRFGKSGKVITVVRERFRHQKKTVDDPGRLKNLFTKLGITPVKVEHFRPGATNGKEE